MHTLTLTLVDIEQAAAGLYIQTSFWSAELQNQLLSFFANKLRTLIYLLRRNVFSPAALWHFAGEFQRAAVFAL